MLFWGCQTIPTKQSCVLETEYHREPTTAYIRSDAHSSPAPLHSIPLLPALASLRTSVFSLLKDLLRQHVAAAWGAQVGCLM